jgi:type IV secretion system protein VirD4
MNRLLYDLDLSLLRIAGLFSRKGDAALHTARFARLDELENLITHNLQTDASLLLGQYSYGAFLRAKRSNERRELGNMLVCARTGGGKGLLAVSQLLTWPHSVIVNDIKGDLFTQTAGYRSKIGKVYVLDPTGVGHRFDPTLGKNTDLELKSIAKNLLYKGNEGEGEVFIERATRMLAPIFHAGRLEKIPLLAYIASLINEPLSYVVQRVHTADPKLAVRMLECEFQEADFQDRFLTSAWGTLTSRLDTLLAESVVGSFTGSDFTMEDVMCQDKPITVYIRLTEEDLLVLAPLIKLWWTSFITGLTTAYGKRGGKGCRPVLLLLDEAGRTAVPNLPEYASTVRARGISLWIAVQDLAQLEIYGKYRAKSLRNNCDTQIYYRPNDLETAKYIEERLGRKSDYAHSQTSREGKTTSQGQSEQGVPLMTAQEIMCLKNEEIIGFHSNLKPFRAKRMDWRDIPLLKLRLTLTPPQLPILQQQTSKPQEGRQSDKKARLFEPLDPDALMDCKTDPESG